jgi:SAM-dependent methyltransferase/uncharacterized protein YbaR (Trm112 family)
VGGEPRVHPAVACPACKSGLERIGDDLRCLSCRAVYRIDHEIPRLFAGPAELTIRPADLRLKSRGESVATTLLQRQIDFGFITRPRWFYGLYLLLAIALIARSLPGAAAVIALCLADWLYYRIRQGRILDAFEANPLRLRTPADVEAVDALYERLGLTQPSMDDWSRLAWESSGVAFSEAHWRPQVAERYLEIREHCESRDPRPEIVVDVGANDGQAFWDFGIGSGSTRIGIDVSHLLLRSFREHLPDQVALQADGLCLPLKDESVDFLFCTETLEHLTDPGRAIAEFFRVLRPGGMVVVQSPNAHRLRNLNPFEILLLSFSVASDRVVRKKVVQENTWHNASTFHWDFSLQDYRRMLRGLPVGRRRLYSREFFFPQRLLFGHAGRFRAKEKFMRRIPIWRFTGNDLVLVAEKAPRPA